MTVPEHVVVIVPAHNEAAEIEGCLRSILAAADAGASPGLSVRIIAVADDCMDATLSIIDRVAADRPEVIPLVVPYGNVGRARNAAGQLALEWAAEGSGDPGAADLWLAFTDADSRVPTNWLVSHLAHARRGADCVVGTVAPRSEPGNADLVSAWYSLHRLADDHDHVFGANLGIRGSVFAAVGGCPPDSVGEDEALVAAVTSAGRVVHRTDDCRVITSARLQGRCHGGFAAYLRDLVRDGHSERHLTVTSAREE